MSTGQPILDNVIAGILIAMIFWTSAKAGKLVSLASAAVSRISSRYGLRLARHDLNLVQKILADRNEEVRFMLARLLLLFLVLSVDLVFVSIALIDQAMVIAAPLICMVTLMLYFVALHSYAVIHWTRHPERFVPIIEGCVKRHEARLVVTRTAPALV